MNWGRLQRAYFFGCSCLGCRTNEELALSAQPPDEDSEFLYRYGAPGRRGCPSFEDRLRQQGGVQARVARCVISRITEIVQQGDHASPKYNWPRDMQPLITVGRMNDRGAIRGNHFGLIVFNGHIHLWRHETHLRQDNIHVATDEVPVGWTKLPLRAGLRAVWIYDRPLDCHCDGSPDPTHPLSAGPLFDLLRSIGEDLAQTPQSGPLQNALTSIRQEVEEPFSDADGDEDLDRQEHWNVIYPRIARKFLDERAYQPSEQDPPEGEPGSESRDDEPSPTEASFTTAGHDSAPKSTQSLPAHPAAVQCPNRIWFGLILVDAGGVLRSVLGTWEQVARDWTLGVYPADQVIFMVSRSQKGVDQVLGDIHHIHQASEPGAPMPALAPPPSGTSYIYAYHHVPGTWGNVFYVGKGRATRRHYHVRKVFDRIRAGAPGPGVPVALSPKEETIERYLRTPQLLPWPAEAPQIEGKYHSALEEPPARADPCLLRIVQTFPPGWESISDERSQAAEKFLINFRYGIYNVSNATRGNDPAGFGLLVRPNWWSHTDPEAHRWQAACDYMIANGRLAPLQMAQLNLPIVRPYLPAIDGGLDGLGVVPAAAHPSGGVAAYPHLSPAGAGDLMLTYDVRGRRYQLEIRMDARQPLGSIRMRPGHFTSVEFAAYVNEHTRLQVVRPGDPYFRPFQRCGGATERGVLFAVDTTPNGAGFESIDVEFRGDTPPPWMGCHLLNLFEAIQMILNRFPY